MQEISIGKVAGCSQKQGWPGPIKAELPVLHDQYHNHQGWPEPYMTVTYLALM
jgi:hypothetical protein